MRQAGGSDLAIGPVILKKCMVCAEKTRLIAAYAAIIQRYATAVAKLRATTDQELPEALIASEAARAECSKARRAVQKHKAEHRC
jgi:hypothetical protein